MNSTSISSQQLPDGTRLIKLRAQAQTLEIDGRSAEVLTYDGSLPGPLLEIDEGDRVRWEFENGLSEPTNLHLHGLHLPPEVDAPHRVLQPGEASSYSFTVPQGAAGTYWYHPHLHGRVTRQLFQGLAGALIVRGPADRDEALAAAQEHVLVLQDLSIRDGKVAEHTDMEWGRGKEGELVLVNGQRLPTLPVQTGLLRLRLVNASTARYYHLSVPGHRLQVIGFDGSMLEAPVPMESVLLVPGERADVLVQVSEAGRFTLTNLPYARAPHSPMFPAPAEFPLLTFAATGPTRACTLPVRLRDIEKVDETKAVAHRTFTFTAAMNPLRFMINGEVYDHARTDLTVKANTLEVWELRNPTAMDHPFHLHVFPFQVLTRDGKPEPFRAWRDVVNLRAGETVRIAVPFVNFTGDVMVHCHIVEHEDRGMMANVRVAA